MCRLALALGRGELVELSFAHRFVHALGRLGIGADSTPAVKAERTTPPEQPEGFVIKRTTGQHAHNLFLQTWYELGVFGVILVAIAGAAIVSRILLLPALVQPYAAAAFTIVAAIATFAWGVWQVWLVCAVALLPVYLLMAARQFRDAADAQDAPVSQQ